MRKEGIKKNKTGRTILRFSFTYTLRHCGKGGACLAGGRLKIRTGGGGRRIVRRKGGLMGAGDRSLKVTDAWIHYTLRG